MASQAKQIEALNSGIKGLKHSLDEAKTENTKLLRENQDLKNQLRDALFAAEERLKIISTLPDLNKYCEVKTFQSKVNT